MSCLFFTSAVNEHRLVEMGQRILGKEPSSWFGPTSAAQAVGHLFEASKVAGPDFLKTVGCAVFVDGPIYKASVMEHFDNGCTSVILFVCRRLGLESCNLDEYQQGLDSCFRLPEFQAGPVVRATWILGFDAFDPQGLASGNSSSSAHFFVATHGEESLLFLDPHVTHPALQKPADVIASGGLRAERPLRLPWTSLNPSICVAFLEFVATHKKRLQDLCVFDYAAKFLEDLRSPLVRL
eukprot:g25601.t1